MKGGCGQRTPAAHGIYIMDEKDRTIVTFGGDPEPEKISQNSGFASGQDELRVDVEIPQEVKPEVRPYKDTGAGADTGDYLAEKIEAEYGSSGDVSHGTVPHEAAAPQADYSVSKHAAVKTSRQNKSARDPRYVTKGALAVCMVLTMLVSSVLGGLIGGALSSGKTGIVSSPATDGGSSSKSISEATGSDLTISEIVDMNADSVVEILVSGNAQGYFGQMQPVEGAGSGVIYSKDGYIVTNYHVIQGANKVQVTLHNGETYPASIVGGNNDMDIAVIKINANDLKPAKVGDSSTVEVGDTAVAIGNPLGQLGGTATTGIISALDRNLTIEGRTLSLMQTDAAINGGNSGGGLFNSKGELIGIVDAKSSGVGIEGLAFALPINSVVDDIDDIIENGNVSTRPVVGVTIADVSEDTARYYQLESAGVYITQVTGENAKKAGFQSEDRIVSLDGEEISSSQQFVAAVRKHKAGDVVTIVVSRSGQEIEIKTELEEYTESNL